MPSQKRRLWWAKLSLAAASVLLTLLAAEVALRLLSREKVELEGLYSRDEVAGVALTPGFRGSMRTAEFEYGVAVNELGMRDGPAVPKPAGVRRVLMLGDSFVFGVGVELEDSLPKALARRLAAAAPEAPVEVLNAGVPGYSPFQELHALERLAPIIEPDLVVLVFFIGDDWYGNARRKAPEEARRGPVAWLERRSTLYRTFDRFLLARLKGRDHYEIHRRVPPPDFERRVGEVLELLDGVRTTAASRGAPLLVALCPRFTQVYPDAWGKAALVYRLSEEQYSPLEPNRSFGGRLAAAGFWHLDLLEPLRTEGGRRMLHFPVDGHLNAAGNEFVAGLLAAAIEPWLAGDGAASALPLRTRAEPDPGSAPATRSAARGGP